MYILSYRSPAAIVVVVLLLRLLVRIVGGLRVPVVRGGGAAVRGFRGAVAGVPGAAGPAAIGVIFVSLAARRVSVPSRAIISRIVPGVGRRGSGRRVVLTLI